MTTDEGTINCLWKSHNINITKGKYVFNSPMISIPMGGIDVVLVVHWFKLLGTLAFNFQKIFMKFS